MAVPAEDRGISGSPTSTAPLVTTSAARPSVTKATCSPAKLPAGEHAKLTANEADDNDRWDTLAQQFCRDFGRDLIRRSWQWIISFFKAESGFFRKRFQSLTARGAVFPTTYNPDGRQLHELYWDDPGKGIVDDFYNLGRWFQSTDEASLPANFLFEKGDVLIFGQGHSSIVTGSHTTSDVVLCHMSWNRTTQDYYTSYWNRGDYPAGENYGVTRNTLKDLRAAQGRLAIYAGSGRAFNRPFVHYRLKPQFWSLQLFDSELKKE